MSGSLRIRPVLLASVLAVSLAGPAAADSGGTGDGPPLGGIGGTVSTEDETALAGATVEVRRDDVVVATTRTATDGSWTVEALPDDGQPYSVEVSAPDHAPRQVGEYDGAALPEPNVWVSGGATIGVSGVTLRRLTATISGRVVGGDGPRWPG